MLIPLFCCCRTMPARRFPWRVALAALVPRRFPFPLPNHSARSFAYLILLWLRQISLPWLRLRLLRLLLQPGRDHYRGRGERLCSGWGGGGYPGDDSSYRARGDGRDPDACIGRQSRHPPSGGHVCLCKALRFLTFRSVLSIFKILNRGYIKC